MTEDRQRTALVHLLRQQGIRDERVLAAIATVPREAFVEAPFSPEAYADTALPIACGQTISQPYIVALMTEALKVGPASRVLEIGTGSGYQAAVLGRLAGHVFSVERHPSLSEVAAERLRRLGIGNVTCRIGDGSLGLPAFAPYDRIMVTAAASEVPPPLLDQLATGGIMVIPLGDRPENQHLWRITRGPTGLTREDLLAVRFVPLVQGLPPGHP